MDHCAFGGTERLLIGFSTLNEVGPMSNRRFAIAPEGSALVKMPAGITELKAVTSGGAAAAIYVALGR